jgi:uncharacterized protein YndB with AHSA1/START domain
MVKDCDAPIRLAQSLLRSADKNCKHGFLSRTGVVAMIHVQATIEINTSPAEVFRLLCDPELKTRLNPDVELLQAAVLSPEPLAVGSRIFYRLRTPHGVSEFHCDVSAFETNRLIEWVSDTQPQFRVRQVIEATTGGCRLIHEETLQTAEPAKPRKWSLADLAQAFQQAAGLDAPTAPGENMQQAMQAGLTRWLENMRVFLEAPRPEPDAEFHTISTVAF